MAKKQKTADRSRSSTIFYGLASVVLVFAVLYLAKPVLVPLALGVLLTFILTPAVIRMEKWRVPRIPAVLGVTLVTFAMLFLVFWMIGGQIRSLATDLPNHQTEITNKIALLKSSKHSTFNRLLRMFDEVSKDFSSTEDAENDAESDRSKLESNPNDSAIAPATIVVAADKTPAESALEILTPIVEPLATTALIVVLVMFLLINREDIRFRMLSLWGRGSLTGTTRLMTDASNRVSSYLANLFLVNAAFGLWFGVGLYFIGVPYAPLWGFLTLVLRFIPFLGSPASVLFPLLISFATSEGWIEPIIVAVFFGVSELFVANIVEPILFGKTTGMSPIALLVAALFWAWLWGPIGLLLSTPLTVCMVVLGQHIPSLGWLKILLAEQSEMEPWLQYYQRLLSKDRHEAAALLKSHSAATSTMKTYNDIVIPALNWTRQERQAGDIDAEEAAFVWFTTQELLDEEESRLEAARLAEQSTEQSNDSTKETADDKAISEDLPEPQSLPVANIIGYPAHHESEELVLAMLKQLLPGDVEMAIASTHSLPNQILKDIESLKPVAVVVGVLPPGGLPQVEFFCEECRVRAPETQIIVAYLGEIEDYDKLLVDLRRSGATYLTTSLEQTKNQLVSIVESWREKQSDFENTENRATEQMPPPKMIVA